jgi:SecD/SecF fusion protein
MPWYVLLLIIVALFTVPFIFGSYLARAVRMPDYGWKIGLILFTLTTGLVILTTGWPPKLGIDLSGGTILVYEVDQSKKQDPDEKLTDQEMDQLIAAVGRRINPGGVKEITIRKYGVEQIEIIIPLNPEVDAEEARRIENLVSQEGTLEFRILANPRDHGLLIERARQEDTQKIKDANGELLAWWVPVEAEQAADFERMAEIATRTRKIGDRDVLEVLVVNDEWNVTGGYLTRAVPAVDQTGNPSVSFQFNATGGQLFGGLTGTNVPDKTADFYRKLGIILDGYLYSAPRIQSAIFDRGEITGRFTQEEAEDLAAVLTAGSLPTALDKEPISRLETGPTLGQDTIDRGTWAIGVSLILVLVFMPIYYRFSGLIACGALLTNLVLILAIMIAIKAAFTLPGLAGLVLTVGMAVDANVLIFERIREELKRGAALRMAIRNGFSRASTAIVDANVTTLIVAAVLFTIGTDQVKGFAVVLGLGVVLSMYTAIFCSRVVFDIAERRRWISKLKMLHILSSPQIDFLGRKSVAITGSLTIIVIGLAGVVTRGAGLLDIDFTGGVSVQVVFKSPQEIADVRAQLADLPDLTVKDVRLSGEAEGVRFVVNTSQSDIVGEDNPEEVEKRAIDVVEDHIHDVFGDQLASNSLTIDQLGAIEPTGKAAEKATTEEEPAEPAATEQTRSDLPSETLLALTDPDSILLTQADSEDASEEGEVPPAEPLPADLEIEAEPETSSPTDNAAEEPVADGDEEPAEDAPAEAADTAADQTPAEPVATAVADGTQAQLTFARALSEETLRAVFAKEFGSERATPELKLSSPTDGYQEGDEKGYLVWDVKIDLPPEQTKARLESIQKRVADTPLFPSSNTIGGKVAGNTRTAAIVALLASLLCIVGYIWIRFQRVMFGLAAVVALVHDVLVTLGMIALSAYVASYLGFLLIDPFKIGLSVLAAFLTIIGYSLNDTIVVFDRIREVRGKSPQLTAAMVNTSINQTLSRTLLTSLTTMIVVVILYIFGGEGVHAFAFTLVIGVIVGTYSSIFVASPALLWMSRPAATRK